MTDQVSAILQDGVASHVVFGQSKLRLIFRAMRPYQWSKNLFVVSPILFAKKITDPEAFGYAILAFAAFCLMASGLYIFNDWIDIDEDRSHPDKQNRPLSSGALPVRLALSVSALLVFGALGLAWTLGKGFLFIAVLYCGLTLAYSVALKRFIILDCIAIASGFVLRVVGGSVAIGVVASHWLIACTFLLALFLAFSKRRQELLKLSTNASEHREVLGQYTIKYLDQVNIIVMGAAIVAYALYTVAAETTEKFGTDALIYGTVFVVYGILRYLALMNDVDNGGDPSKVLVRDRPLLVALIGWALYNAAVIYRGSFLDLFR
jgi:4-hydroxybenzoate polyprenyltransferase